jgi:transcriptional regulator of acetoin/glycerol metabolism
MLDIEIAKDAVVRGERLPCAEVHPDVATSWVRSAEAVGSPWSARVVPHVDLSSIDRSLGTVLQQPLDHMARTLDDSGMVLILADSEGRVLHCWSSDAAARKRMEQASTGPGSVVAECAIGTNAAGTALVTGKPIVVKGAEHYAELYHRAACAAAPVRHPVDGRVLGVVTLGMTDQPDVRFLLPMTKMLASHVKSHLSSVLRATGRLPIDDDGDAWRPRHQPRTRIEQLEVEAIREALIASGGLRDAAARRLGWSRSTLYRRMRAYQLEFEDLHDAG